jgi:uncharacterized protein YaiL (DUF2058 family)
MARGLVFVSKSLQDQLLALGLAKERAAQPQKTNRAGGKAANPAHKPAHSDGQNSSQQNGSSPGHKHHSKSGAIANRASGAGSTPAPQAGRDISLEQAYRIREHQEKSEKQRERDRKLEEDRKRAALNRQIKQIVDAGRLNLPDASESRYFMYKDRIRKIHVSAEQLLEVNSGILGVVYLAGGYHLLKADQVEAVRTLSPSHVPELLTGGPEDDELWAAEEATAAGQEAERDGDMTAEPPAEPESGSEPKSEPGTEPGTEAWTGQ